MIAQFELEDVVKHRFRAAKPEGNFFSLFTPKKDQVQQKAKPRLDIYKKQFVVFGDTKRLFL